MMVFFQSQCQCQILRRFIAARQGMAPFVDEESALRLTPGMSARE